MKVYLSKVSEELSSVQCPECGRCHKVSFEMREAGALLPLWFPNFEDGTCESFKELVRKRLKTL